MHLNFIKKNDKYKVIMYKIKKKNHLFLFVYIQITKLYKLSYINFGPHILYLHLKQCYNEIKILWINLRHKNVWWTAKRTIKTPLNLRTDRATTISQDFRPKVQRWKFTQMLSVNPLFPQCHFKSYVCKINLSSPTDNIML